MALIQRTERPVEVIRARRVILRPGGLSSTVLVAKKLSVCSLHERREEKCALAHGGVDQRERNRAWSRVIQTLGEIKSVRNHSTSSAASEGNPPGSAALTEEGVLVCIIREITTERLVFF